MTKKEKSDNQENIDSELKKSGDSKDDTAKSHGEILKQQIIEGQKNLQ